MKKAEVLLSLVIGIVGSLLASLLQKIPWIRISRAVIHNIKLSVNAVAALGLIVVCYYKNNIQSLKLVFASSLTTALCMLLLMWGGAFDPIRNTRIPTEKIVRSGETPPLQPPEQTVTPKAMGEIYAMDDIRARIASAPAGNCEKVIPKWSPARTLPGRKRGKVRTAYVRMCVNVA